MFQSAHHLSVSRLVFFILSTRRDVINSERWWQSVKCRFNSRGALNCGGFGWHTTSWNGAVITPGIDSVRADVFEPPPPARALCVLITPVPLWRTCKWALILFFLSSVFLSIVNLFFLSCPSPTLFLFSSLSYVFSFLPVFSSLLIYFSLSLPSLSVCLPLLSSPSFLPCSFSLLLSSALSAEEQWGHINGMNLSFFSCFSA